MRLGINWSVHSEPLLSANCEKILALLKMFTLWFVTGCKKFVPVLAGLFCLAMPRSCIILYCKQFSYSNSTQGSAKRLQQGLVNSVPAVAYHFGLNLPAAFTQPGANLLAEICTYVSTSIVYYP